MPGVKDRELRAGSRGPGLRADPEGEPPRHLRQGQDAGTGPGGDRVGSVGPAVSAVSLLFYYLRRM